MKLNDVAAMVETGSPPITTVTLDGEKYVPAAMLTNQAERIKELEADRDEMEEHARNNGREGWKQYERAEAAEKRNAELETLLAEAVKVLEPFGLISSEGVIQKEKGHVHVIVCAEYFHAASAFIAKLKEKQDADA